MDASSSSSSISSSNNRKITPDPASASDLLRQLGNRIELEQAVSKQMILDAESEADMRILEMKADCKDKLLKAAEKEISELKRELDDAKRQLASRASSMTTMRSDNDDLRDRIDGYKIFNEAKEELSALRFEKVQELLSQLAQISTGHITIRSPTFTKNTKRILGVVLSGIDNELDPLALEHHFQFAERFLEMLERNKRDTTFVSDQHKWIEFNREIAAITIKRIKSIPGPKRADGLSPEALLQALRKLLRERHMAKSRRPDTVPSTTATTISQENQGRQDKSRLRPSSHGEEVRMHRTNLSSLDANPTTSRSSPCAAGRVL
jgi:regulator of replication initiation timing